MIFSGKGEECKGTECKYYSKKYSTVVYDGAHTPDFSVAPTEYCQYSLNTKHSIEDNGTPLSKLRKCPLNG